MIKLNNKNFWLMLSVIFIVIFIYLLYFFINLNKQKNISINSTQENKKIENKINDNNNKVRRLIDGVFVNKEVQNIQPVAIMINNHIDARPTSGLSQANLVIEAETEGGITRYMAIFANNFEIQKIGSIRSARPYFIDWAQELDAVYVHCGGSPEALVKIAKDGIKDMNEFYNGDFFWRDKERVAPHNIFTSSLKIKDFLDKKDFKKGDYFSWEYKEDLDLAKRPINSEIKIKYILKGFNVTWKYDKKNNEYIRYLGNNLHTESDGEIISAKNIIIQYVNAKEIDDKLRLRMDILGKGKAKICTDGACHNVNWKKNSNKSRTRFYNILTDSKQDEDAKEFKFNSGTTWIEIVRPEISVVIS